MSRYSLEEKKRAVELYIQNDCSSILTIRELGYPSRSCLCKWYHRYIDNGNSLEEDYKNHRRSKYTAEQRKIAVEYYLNHGKSIFKTIHALGYPGKSALCDWLNEDVPDKNRKWVDKKSGIAVRCTKEQKSQAVVDYCSGRKTASQITKEYGIGSYTIYTWKREVLGDKSIKMKNLKSSVSTDNVDIESLKDNIQELTKLSNELQEKVYKLQLEHDVLEKAAEIIKKDQGIILSELTNREKAIVIDTLRNKYTLKELLSVFNMAKSSYCYQIKAIKATDKYEEARTLIRKSFYDSNESYGYRRVNLDLHDAGLRVSEKVVRRLMKDEHLRVKTIKKKKYSSYQGEITPAVENIIKRDFHADAPNKKWLTDITEFSIPAGKVYLSPIIDCFDGLPVSWTIGTHPDADLVNTMLDNAIATLDEVSKPIVHSDRGAHYRWPGWIQRMDDAGLTRSMSKKGCSPDNSACEGFFGRLKNEMFYDRAWRDVSIEDFITAVDNYIHWYAEKRRKVSLGGLSPIEYRRSLGLI